MPISPENVDLPPVAIIGAGPAGLMTALVLTELRVPVKVYERNLEPTTQWRAPGIHARTMELFARYGLEKNFLSVGNPATSFTTFAGKRRFIGVSFGALRSEFPFILACAQTNTESILRKRLEELNVHVNWGWEFVGYEVCDDAQGINIHLKNAQQNDQNSDLVQKVAYLAGCDGGRSRVRKTIGATFDGNLMDVRMAVCDVKTDADWLSVGNMSMHPSGILGLVRVNGATNYRLFTTWEDSNGEITAENFAAVAKHRMAPREFTNLQVLSVSSFTINERRASRFTSKDGRVFLCGDAAHIHSPAGGQGMNTGLQDGENLAWKLAAVYHGYAKQELLETYGKERIPVADKVIELSRQVFGYMRFPRRGYYATYFLSLVNYLPLFIRRPITEQTAQLSIYYDSKDNFAVQSERTAWTRATGRGWWWPSRWFAEHLNRPGMRAMDGEVVDLALEVNSSRLRLRHWQAERRGTYSALIFIDCSLAVVDTSTPNAGDSHCLTKEELIQLAAVVDALHEYRMPISTAFLLHHQGKAWDLERNATAYRSITSQLTHRCPSVRVFADAKQGDRYGNFSLAGLYDCGLLNQHGLYLIRPDAYVATRSPLPDAIDAVREHLDMFASKA
ncbi:hypothetical protein K7432_016403 [Basidiobolus ranarum]|uniref:FAD-binding domain-containing protein n=1 Tax=Basidiobolus ranarum TaxID=34480 RepID=A0ABR2WES9_9FUNG